MPPTQEALLKIVLKAQSTKKHIASYDFSTYFFFCIGPQEKLFCQKLFLREVAKLVFSRSCF
jgi:hypothetical protein